MAHDEATVSISVDAIIDVFTPHIGWPDRETLRERLEKRFDLDAALDAADRAGFARGYQDGKQEGRDEAIAECKAAAKSIMADNLHGALDAEFNRRRLFE